jgi:multiple sugar transport system permease protein
MKTRVALLMLLPMGVIVLVTFLWPMVMVGRLSFMTGYKPPIGFVGLENYRRAFMDHYFIKSFVNAFVMIGFIVPPMIVIAYVISLQLMGLRQVTQAVVRFVIYLPYLATGMIIALLWGWLLMREGLVNMLLAYLFRIPAIPWLTEVWTARIAISMIYITSGIGAHVLMFSAAMSTLPKELENAAIIDGANSRQYRKYIVRPLMLPTILLLILLAIIGVMQTWELIYFLTGEGGPEGSTATPVYEVYLTAFKFGRIGLSAAKGVILMFVIAAFLVMKRRVEKWVR